jgi:hypothetical protein
MMRLQAQTTEWLRAVPTLTGSPDQAGIPPESIE